MQPRGRAAAREEEAIERLDDLLTTSVRDRVVADVPVGVFLSGGLDSSLITVLAAKAAPGLTAFSVRVGQDSFDETAHAAEVARLVGVRHEIVAARRCRPAFRGRCHYCESSANRSRIHRCCRPTSCAGRRGGLMTVALGGDGADELFLGYPNFCVAAFCRSDVAGPAGA